MKFNGHNVSVSSSAKIGNNVKLGDNVVIYDNAVIEDDTIICNDTIIGEPLAPYYSDSSYRNPPTIIGHGSLIRSHGIIYAGCEIGPQFSTGHRITIRENTIIGEGCSIGTMSDIQGLVRIGNYCRFHSNVHISQKCQIGDFVFMYPFSVMTNDPYPPSEDIKGGFIGDYTQIGVHAVILPGVKIGENCLIGANSLVSKRVPSYSLAIGNPAKVLLDIREYIVPGKGRPYPWMKRFERGMPWEGIGYEAWIQQRLENARI